MLRTTRLAIFLILAVAFAPLASIHASWSCPDGTPCEAADEGRYECANDGCEVATCCEVPATHQCRHGAWPAASPTADQAGLSGPESCRFLVSGARAPLAVMSDLRVDPAGAHPALPVVLSPTLAAGDPSPAGALRTGDDYRPPPLRRASPPRAPPLA